MIREKIILVLMIAFFTCSLQTQGQNIAQTLYTISIDKENPKLANVKINLTLQNDTLYMSQMGAGQLPKRWATFVHNLEVFDEKKQKITYEELPNAQWKVKAKLGTKLNISYQIKLEHENYEWSGGIDGVAYAKDWGVFYTGPALFIMNGNDDSKQNIKIKFIIPEIWKVSTPWEKENPTSFYTNKITDLAESMIFAGTHEEIIFKREDFELVFAFGGKEIIAQKKEFRKLAEGVLDYYIDLMGGVPNPPPNNKFKKSVVIINSHTSTDGEVIGNNICILLEENGDEMSKIISRFIFAHEFFHLWNGKTFIPDNENMEWFKEGITNYYTLKALYHVGFLNDKSYLDVLNNFFYQRYINDSGAGTMSMALGEEKHEHWGLIYGGGMFIGICQDMMIRKASKNQKSLDDLMKLFFKKYGGTENTYSLQEVIKVLSELSNQDQTKFFDEYVNGVKIIPIEKYLTFAGLNTKVENNNLILKNKAKVNKLEQLILRGLFGEN